MNELKNEIMNNIMYIYTFLLPFSLPPISFLPFTLTIPPLLCPSSHLSLLPSIINRSFIQLILQSLFVLKQSCSILIYLLILSL